MNKKLLIPVLAIAFVMLATPALAATETYHMMGRYAIVWNIYCPSPYLELYLTVVEGKDIGSAKWVMFMDGFLWDGSNKFSFHKELSPNEFKWSWNAKLVTTLFDMPLTVDWTSTALNEKTHVNEFSDHDEHWIFNGAMKDATATAKLGDLNFYFDQLSQAWVGNSVDAWIIKN